MIVKLFIAGDPYWQRKVANEIDTLVHFRDDPPPIDVPDLIAADPQRGVVIVGRLPGAVLADQRHPTSAPDPRVLAELLETLDRLAAWRPNADVFAREGNYMHRFARYQERGILDADDMRSLEVLVKRHDESSHVFCHGDVLPANVLTTPAGVALIDWEFAGSLLPGYDAALLWTLHGGHPEARRQIEEHVAAGAVDPDCFLVNLAMTVTRELRRSDHGVCGGAGCCRRRGAGSVRGMDFRSSDGQAVVAVQFPGHGVEVDDPQRGAFGDAVSTATAA